MADQHPDFEVRLARATRDYAERARLDRAPDAVVTDITMRPIARPRRVFATAALALILAVTGGLVLAQLVSDGGWPPGAPPPTEVPAELPQVWPAEALPPPYDWAGVRASLAPRGLELHVAAIEERLALTVQLDEAMDEAMTRVLDGHQHARPTFVGVHLAAVSQRNERLERDLVRELMYVVETTGHATGNCFTLLPATQSDAPTIGACFYPNRSSPP